MPVVAPAGTRHTICVLDQLVNEVAVVPLNITLDVPCDEPKLAPVIVTDAPTEPLEGEMPEIFGDPGAPGFVFTNVTELLLCEETETVTSLMVEAALGTEHTICVLLQLIMSAETPLKYTCAAVCPKFIPVMVIDVPGGPLVELKLKIPG